MRGWFGWQCSWGRGYALLAALAVLALARPAMSQPLARATNDKVRVGFSNLVARLDSDEIGIAKAELRVHILEALRAAGFNAVGAESLVFERDEGNRAELVLGGTVRELQCKRVKGRTNCRVGLTWELLDVELDAVVYRVLTRHMEPGVDVQNGAVAGRRLVLGALRNLMGRDRFKALLGEARSAPSESTSYPTAGFRACHAKDPRELPAHFDEVAEATYLVKQAGGFGSGFSISPDGLVLTAAHVVSGKTVELSTRGSTSTRTAAVVRISRKQDVALLSLPPGGGDQPCLELEPTAPASGADVFAIGSPASQDFAFSLTRGIVSGLRLVDGVQLIQTDASLSPGNSGGPLLDARARVVGVVSRKISGRAVEGLGFGTQIGDALQALGLQQDLTTSAALNVEATAPAPSRAVGSVDDVDTSLPSLDPEGDRRRAEQADHERRLKARDDATPWFVKPMRYGGLTLGLVGAFGIAYTTASANQREISHPDYLKYRTQNDVSWALFVLGMGAYALSYPLAPPLPPSDLGAAAPALRVGLGLGQVNLALTLDR